MLEIKELQDGDLEYVLQNPLEESVKNYQFETKPQRLSWTVLFEGEIVAVGGVVIYWQGVGEMWFMMTKNSKRHDIYGLIALSAIEKKMNEIINENKLWRIQAVVRTDFLQSIKMVERLGFVRECLMRKYLPDGNGCFLYAKVKE